MLYMISNQELILRLVLAVFLGGLIGVERERLNWAAGLRTHMLVCLGAALIMLVSQYAFNEVVTQGLINLDPSRVAAQVVSGIGFLGAGTILFQKNVIRGLTTAASLWSVAAVGLAVGGGLYLAAICSAVLILIVLAGIKPIERRFIKKIQAVNLKFSVKSGTLSIKTLQEMLHRLNLEYESSRVQVEKTGDRETFYLLFKPTSPSNFSSIMDEIRKLETVENIEFTNEIMTTPP